jgi:hypothetical protein
MKSYQVISRVVALLAVLAVASACVSPLPRIPQLPTNVETATDRDIKAVVGNLQQLMTLLSRPALTISRIEDEAAKGGVIPASADAQFDHVASEFYTALKTASDRLVAGGLESWPELRALVAPVLEKGQQFVDLANNIGAIRTRIEGFLAQLRDTLSATAGEFLFGGAR